MTTLTKKIKNGHPYWYAVESARVNGKPRIVWQKYLGRAEDVVARVQQENLEPQTCQVREFGSIAAFLNLAEELGIPSIIDKYVPKRNQGASISQYVLLAAINRAVSPESKLKIGDWYENSILPRIWGLQKNVFTSQRFWDAMDRISEEAIYAIETDIVESLIEKEKLDCDTLLFDATNFDTYISSLNDRNTIADFGHAKSKRSDLRIVGLAVMANRRFGIPLFHEVYKGNMTDASLFRSVILQLKERFQQLKKRSEDLTLVFDRGNNGRECFEIMDMEKMHFVSALRRNQFPELFDIPLSEFRPLYLQELAGFKAYTCKRQIHGKERTVVVIFSDRYFSEESHAIMNDLVKGVRKLNAEAKRVSDWHEEFDVEKIKRKKGIVPRKETLQERIKSILSKHQIGPYIKFETSLTREGLPSFEYEIDQANLNEHINHICGKNTYFTDREDWVPDDIVRAYNDKNDVETCFSEMKDWQYLRWEPMFHWTDQKIRVHGFYCILALMLTKIARKRALQAGLPMSSHELLDKLNHIKEVVLFYQGNGKSEKHPKISTTYSDLDSTQKKLFDLLNLSKYQVKSSQTKKK